LTNTERDGKISNDGILSLTASVGDHHAPTIRLSELRAVYVNAKSDNKTDRREEGDRRLDGF